ncbi:Bro-N domain-containing protein [Vibrio fluvialis]|nr:Bro-N domain-containing protein [Vibrio fluvialis]
MTSALTFQNTRFDVIEQNNQIWLSSGDIATALGYKSPKSVTTIFNRNVDEFSSGMSEVINLMTSGNYQKSVRIFSLRGAHLIAMFARTSIAKQFRKWVLDILDQETKTQTLIPITNPARIPKANWPITYRTDWKPASITLFGKTSHYICFDLQPKPFSCEFSAKHTPQIYQATFHFADQNKRPIKLHQGNQPEIGDVGYFESTHIDDLWVQVIGFASRCNSCCALL